MLKQIGSVLIAFTAIVAPITSAATPPVTAQTHFPTPDRAVRALIGANRENDRNRLLAILGADGLKLIRSGDPTADAQSRTRFVAAFDDAHKLELHGRDKAVLVVGKDEWPLPIPLIREPGGWRFDTKAGEQEILDRRVGRDELKVIGICRAYVMAQREYAALRIGGRPEFASRFTSTSGKHDGLYWPAKPGDAQSPLGPLVAQAQAAGYTVEKSATAPTAPRPYYGYYFRILMGQGPDAAGGAEKYIVGGHMTRGFALIAYPAAFGASGIMTFIVNQNGIVFEKNLGPGTRRAAGRILQYDPDASWHAP